MGETVVAEAQTRLSSSEKAGKRRRVLCQFWLERRRRRGAEKRWREKKRGEERNELLGSTPNSSSPVTRVTNLDCRFLAVIWMGAGDPFLRR